MNIVGENFPEAIVKQIGIRQSKKGAKNRNPGGDPSLLVWQNANTGWVKMVSSVDINADKRKKISNVELAKTILPDNELAKQYVLFGGVYTQGLGKNGLRGGISRDKEILSDNAYGIGGVDYGILPMPGITSFSIKTETRGSLKTATIGIKAFNRYQFDIINTLYLSLGYSVLIEWGNTMYYDNDSENLKSNDEINQFSLADEFLGGSLKWNDISTKIQENRIKSCGNYDAALGKVVNFSWTLNRDLSYNITLTVRTIGDVIESLKMNALSGYIKPILNLQSMSSQTPAVGGIVNQISSKNNNTLIKDMYFYLVNNIGLNINQSLGVLANIGRESNFEYNKKEIGGGSGIGLFQYTAKVRKNNFLNYAPDWQTNWKKQLDYAFTKDPQGISFKSKIFNSPEDASLDFLINFETPWKDENEQKSLQPIRNQQNLNYLEAVKLVLINTLISDVLTSTYAKSDVLTSTLEARVYAKTDISKPSSNNPILTNQNFLPPSTFSPSISTVTKGGESETIINKNQYTSDIGAIFYNLMLELQSNNIKQEGNDVVATKISFNDGSTTDHYYIRFGYFLKELEDKIIYSLKPTTEPPSKIIKFDYDIDSNIILLYDRQISANPNVCIFRRKFIYSNGDTCDVFPQLNEFLLKDSGDPYTSFYGKLMNVYFDMTFILNEIERLKNNDGSVVLIDLLNSLANGFNSSTGNFNKLSPTVNEDNKIVFIDDVPLPDREDILKTLKSPSSEEAFFSLYGYYNINNKPLAGIVRNLSLTTTVPPNLATMITIGAQANGYVTGQDSTALSTMNLGLTDRVKQEWVEPLKPDNTTEVTQSLEQKYQTEIASFNKFIQEMASNSWNQGDIDAFSNSISSFAEYNQASKTLKQRQTNPTASSPNIGFLPFDLTLEIDGLSGMKVYQKFITDTEFLPSNYPQSLEFLIKGIKNEIKDNQWVTTIESLAIPKNPFGGTQKFNVGAKKTGQVGPTQRAVGAGGTPRPGNFITNASYPNVKFQNIGLGNPANDRINANLLSDVSKAAQKAGVTVSITTAVSGHHSNPASRHTSGNAVDVSIIDGIPVRPDASNRNKIDAFVAALQSLGYVKNAERGNPKAVLTFGFPNHNNHVHISNRA